MRILIFSTAYLPEVGGAEIAVKEITDRLPEHSFDLLTVNLSGREKPIEKMGNVMVYRIGTGAFGKFLFPISGFLKARSLQHAEPYDLLWSIMASQASIAAAFFKTRLKKIPLLLTVQEGDEEAHLARYVGGNQFLYRLLIRPWHVLIFKKADRITAISTYLKKRSETMSEAPVDIVPNGVDVSAFAKQTHAHNKNQNETVLITVSRLVEKNGVGDIISALSLLPAEVKLLIAGEGHLEPALRLQAEKIGVMDRVQFLGTVQHSQLPAFLSRADIFIRPSLSEGMGNAFIEAMATGLPTIGTPIGGIPDFLTDSETGLLCKPHDPASIVAAVSRLRNDPALVSRLVANAHKLVEARYDWNHIAKTMAGIFARMIQ